MLDQWTAAYRTYVVAATEYLDKHTNDLALYGILFCVAVLVGYAAYYDWYKPRKKVKLPRGNRMTGQAREAELRVLLSDKVCDILEDLYVKDKITLEEKMTWTDRFANLCDLRDLLSSKRLTLLQELRMKNKLRKARGKAKAAPIPEPAQQTSKPKNAFDAIVKRSRV